MLFDFESVDLDVGKLAMWRLTTYGTIGGTWLSDYVPNRLGGFLEKSEPSVEKPSCPLIGQDGNIFNLVGIAARTLREAGLRGDTKRKSGMELEVKDGALLWPPQQQKQHR